MPCMLRGGMRNRDPEASGRVGATQRPPAGFVRCQWEVRCVAGRSVGQGGFQPFKHAHSSDPCHVFIYGHACIYNTVFYEGIFFLIIIINDLTGMLINTTTLHNKLGAGLFRGVVGPCVCWGRALPPALPRKRKLFFAAFCRTDRCTSMQQIHSWSWLANIDRLHVAICGPCCLLEVPAGFLEVLPAGSTAWEGGAGDGLSFLPCVDCRTALEAHHPTAPILIHPSPS